LLRLNLHNTGQTITPGRTITKNGSALKRSPVFFEQRKGSHHQTWLAHRVTPTLVTPLCVVERRLAPDWILRSRVVWRWMPEALFRLTRSCWV